MIYNELAGEQFVSNTKSTIEKYFDKDIIYKDICEIDNINEFVLSLQDNDSIIISGGDGTLNRFVNSLEKIPDTIDIIYYPSGTGNDFYRDIDDINDKKPIKINKYLVNLPQIYINDKSYKFINGIGFGIDGYCCEVGDNQKASGVKNVNYTSIAIKGLLFHYKPCNALITVDGKEYNYKKVWMTATMNGRFYGGGMMAAPSQNRLNNDGSQTVMLFYGKGRLRTLIGFPKIFTGEHVNQKNMVNIISGKNIKVTFSEPRTLQIDGETIKNITTYEVKGF